jgi:hypothetical protein
MLVTALNLRYNALSLLPVFFALQLFHLARQSAREGGLLNAARTWQHARVFVLVLVLALTLGLAHYYRVLATYGTLVPSAINISDAGVAGESDFLRRVHERTRLHTAVYLLASYPMLLTWLSRVHLASQLALWRQRAWEVALPLAGVFLGAVHLLLRHDQQRYFAIAAPFLLTGCVLQLHQAREPARLRRLWAWAALSLLLMAIGGLAVALFHPRSADVIPALLMLFPPLQALYL